MEKYLQKLFTEAGQDLKKKFLKYTQDFQRLDAAKQQAVEDGNITEDEYKEWRKNKLLYGMHWQRLIDRNTSELLKYNQTAVKYINGEVPQIFASGYNKVAEQIPDSPVAGFDFELINADTVNNLVHEDGIILPPKKKVDPEKDKAWNAKLINAQLLQGIMQGESIPEMAKRMQTVANSDLAGATRTARTMHTAAQNAGRQSGYNRAAQQGAVFEKTWLAANNERTRLSHSLMNGQTVAHDEKFVSPVTGVKLMFPGDWNAEGGDVGSEIYNCRCTLITRFKGFKKLNGEEPEGTGREAPHTNQENPFVFNLAVDGSAGVAEAINNLSGREKEVWESGINSANYTILEKSDDESKNIAETDMDTREVSLYSDSGERTILHETAHSMDKHACTMEYTTSSKRQMLGQWIESDTWSEEYKGAYSCVRTVFELNSGNDYEKAKREDLVAIYKWANIMYMSDDKPSLVMDFDSSCHDLVEAIRKFKDEYGKEAAANLSDMIEATTNGKFPLVLITGGHGDSYWSKNVNLEFAEGWAEFAQMKAQKQDEAIEAMRKIMPNKINALEEVYNVVFNGKSYEHRIDTEENGRISEEVWRIRVDI
jgi:hypothetical protein